MEDFKRMDDIVERILAEREETRGNDFALIYQFLREYSNSVLPDDMRGIMALKLAKFGCALEDIQKFLNIYTFESITRSRRRLQAKNADLKPSEEAIKARKEKERKYREEARQWKKQN